MTQVQPETVSYIRTTSVLEIIMLDSAGLITYIVTLRAYLLYYILSHPMLPFFRIAYKHCLMCQNTFKQLMLLSLMSHPDCSDPAVCHAHLFTSCRILLLSAVSSCVELV